MKQKDLKIIASRLWKLEQKCQANENVSENLKEMENIANNLSLTDLMHVSFLIEKLHNKDSF